MTKTTNNPLSGGSQLGKVLKALLCVLFFAVVSWVYFYPNDVNGDVLQQHDVLQGLANGHEAAVHAQKTGNTTRWTNALFGGMPTFQISPSYQSSHVLRWTDKAFSLGMPEPVSWVFMLMLGFFILMLAFKVKWYVAVLGSVGYAFSSYFFIIIGAGHIWKLLTLAYIPPTLAGIVWAYRGKYLLGGAVAALFGALQLMSNHVQMTYYSMLIVAALAIGYLIKSIADKKVLRWCVATLVLAVAGALALAANSPNLYMSYEYSKQTMRGGHSELKPLEGQPKQTTSEGGLDKDYITQWSYGIDETWTLLVPNVKGGATVKAENGNMKFLSLADTDHAASLDIDSQDSQNLAVFSQYFGDQPMTNGPVYVGALIFALFLLGCYFVKGPVKWGLLAATILAIMLSWGHNAMWLTNWFIDHFPMYNKFRTVASILVVAELTMPLLGALGVNELLKKDTLGKGDKIAVYCSFGMSALLCILFWLAPGMFGVLSKPELERFVASGQLDLGSSLVAAVGEVRHAMVSSDALRSLFVVALGFGVIMLGTKVKGMPKWATGTLVALIVLVDMWAVDKRYLDTDSFVEAATDTPTSFTKRPVDEKILADTTQNYRVLDMKHFAEAMPSYFHKHVGGYHAAKLSRYNDLIDRQLTQNNMAVLNMLNTKYIIVDDENAQLNPDALGNAWFVDSLTYVKSADEEMSFLDKFTPSRSAVAGEEFRKSLGDATPKAAGDTIAETSYAPDRLTYHSHSANGGVAVFSEIYFPWGWNATIDGKPAEIGRVNYVLRALKVPAGDHTIVMEFKPTAVERTDKAATATVWIIYALAIAAIAVEALRSAKRKGKEQEPAKEENK